MGARKRFAAGDPITQMHSASYHNSIADMLSLFNVRGEALTPGQDLGYLSSTVVWVQNQTGSTIEQFWPVKVLSSTFVDQLSVDEFKNEPFTFQVGMPAAGETGSIGVMLEPIENGEIKLAQFAGWVQCVVDMTDEGHRYALPTGSTQQKLVSSGSGGLPMIPGESGIGDKWCAVRLGSGGGGGGGALFEGYTTADVNGGNFDVNNINIIFGDHPTDATTGNAVLNRPGWIIDAGGWVVVAVDASANELIAIQAECPAAPAYMIWKDEWTDA